MMLTWPKDLLKRTELPLRAILKVVPNSDKFRLGLVAISNVLLSFLEILGLAMIGLLSTLALSRTEWNPNSSFLERILKQLSLDDQSLRTQVLILSSITVASFSLKTLVSGYINFRLLRFLSVRSALISDRLIRAFFSETLISYQKKRTLQRNLYNLTVAPQAINLGVIGSCLQALSDFVLLTMILVTLAYVDVVSTLFLFILYSVVAVFLYLANYRKLGLLGSRMANQRVELNEKVVELADSYRESLVRNRLDFHFSRLTKTQLAYARNDATLNFMGNLGKYAFEIVLVLTTGLLVLVQLSSRDVSGGVASTSIFLVASARIMPAVLRLQQSIFNMKSSLAHSRDALNMINELEISPQGSELREKQIVPSTGFEGSIHFTQVLFEYPGSKAPMMRGITFHIASGEFVVIQGKTGSGKSTLLDLMLGVLSPKSGSIAISGVSPGIAFSSWPQEVSYVSSSPLIIQGSLRDNLTFGFHEEKFTDEKCMEVLKLSSLFDFGPITEQILEMHIQERGSNISTGQRQRIGIARALMTAPSIIFMDESTNALDIDTELKIITNLRKKASTTVVLVSHRNEVVKYADLILSVNRAGNNIKVHTSHRRTVKRHAK